MDNKSLLVSFLLPTRNRFKWLTESISSIIDNVSQTSHIEILLALDDDDTDTIDEIRNYYSTFIDENLIKLYTYSRKGYHNLHLYVNDLCTHASGRWLFLWNDDAIISTKSWDLILLEAEQNAPKYWVFDTKSHFKFVFPIVSSSIIEELGHYSLNAHNDSWIEVIAKRCNITSAININIYHKKVDSENEKMYTETKTSTSISNPEFHSEKMKQLREKDIETIKQALNLNSEQ